MQMRTVKTSAKGQFTIPKDIFDAMGDPRELVLIEQDGKLIVVPAARAAQQVVDDLGGFSALGLSAFEDVWDNEEDDVWNDV